MNKLVIVGSISDNPFVEDIAHHLQQREDYSDLISLKSFLNREFCPRFIIEEKREDNIGYKLEGNTILIVSSTYSEFSRDELAMRNFLIARAAKDNGAAKVVLLEPDLYYSAQDRGPRAEHGCCSIVRDLEDYKKFDGQPFSSRLYADLLRLSGIDEVITVHNQSNSVINLFQDRFTNRFFNLHPSDVYAEYMASGDLVHTSKLVLCAPDAGASLFVREVQEELTKRGVHSHYIQMNKKRIGEREVNISISGESSIKPSEIRGKDIVILDDMVRTGNTVVECCRELKKYNPARVVFMVTHFFSSREGRINLNDPAVDEIVTTSTIPQILNRDVQGRLRHKLVVLRVARWISSHALRILDPSAPLLKSPLYAEDMSSKNPRWKGKMGPLFS
ncbi:MAG: ribose-phosphate pyrophosphokinase [Spirochaetales bacterium]|nr:ribose-phosphate pyrophosphokinase [Spirochaetales bacterium]